MVTQMQAPCGPVENPDHDNRQDQGQHGGHIHVEVVETSLKTLASEELGDLLGGGQGNGVGGVEQHNTIRFSST